MTRSAVLRGPAAITRMPAGWFGGVHAAIEEDFKIGGRAAKSGAVARNMLYQLPCQGGIFKRGFPF